MNALDLSTVTEVGDIELAGERLWVCPGLLPTGRYWALMTRDNVSVGVVAELGGRFEAVGSGIEAEADTATAAGLLLVAALRVTA
ncbi:hypothetical protein [Kitasatospora indigofera]|uniref:hypothetical protein n=1 Tax=Kitasatospora indigofera TaxID=67307 RepID=UPI0036AB2A1D